jgi:hypothetical protein
MSEERDVPDLPTLLTDITAAIDRLDKTPVTDAEAVKAMVVNDVLPLMKDFIESTLYAFEDIQDLVEPIKITGAEAQNIATILQATLQSNPGNKELAERINDGLEALDMGDDDEEEETQN